MNLPSFIMGIENYAELKDDLIQNDYSFISETDTGIVAVELSRQWNGELLDTVLDVAKS